MLLLIYYNPNHNCFYWKVVNSFTFNKEVGYKNDYGHVLIQMLFVEKGRFLSCSSWLNYYNKTTPKKSSKKKKPKIFNKLIDGAIHLLYKIRE